MSTPDFAEGRRLLDIVDPDLLPLDVDRDSASRPNEWFVCDAMGLEFAVPRECDKGTAELIAWAINNLPRLLDIAEALEVAGDDAHVSELTLALEATTWFARGGIHDHI